MRSKSAPSKYKSDRQLPVRSLPDGRVMKALRTDKASDKSYRSTPKPSEDNTESTITQKTKAKETVLCTDRVSSKSATAANKLLPVKSLPD